jgi:hypothetical protein
LRLIDVDRVVTGAFATAIIIVVVQHIAGTLCHLMQDDGHAMSATQCMRQVTFRGNDRLQGKQQQQQDEDSILHAVPDIAASLPKQCRARFVPVLAGQK